MSADRRSADRADYPGLVRIVVLGLLALVAAAQQRRIALTIDDLPVAQSGPETCEPERLMPLTRRLVDAFAAERAPLVAFVITGNCPGLAEADRRAALGIWRGAGVELGNHTHSHRSLNAVPIEEYEADILRAQDLLAAWTNGAVARWFRWPMLHAGATPETKRRLENFLREKGLREAPVTFDNSDWVYAYAYAGARRRGDTALAERLLAAYVPYIEETLAFFEERSRALFAREIPQVLLMHSNLLNSEATPALLAMLRARGYAFVSLEQALADPAYATPNDYAAANGISWLHRWAKTLGVDHPWEADPPAWVTEAYEKSR